MMMGRDFGCQFSYACSRRTRALRDPNCANKRRGDNKMSIQRVIGGCSVLALMLSAHTLVAASSDVADAAMNGNKDAVRSLLLKKADVNAPQVDGTTALHWAVRADDLETADMLIRAGANASTANREGVTPMRLAAT